MEWVVGFINGALEARDGSSGTQQSVQGPASEGEATGIPTGVTAGRHSFTSEPTASMDGSSGAGSSDCPCKVVSMCGQSTRQKLGSATTRGVFSPRATFTMMLVTEKYP